MKFIFEYVWVLFFLVVIVVNVIFFKFRFKKFILKSPELEKGYNKLIIGFLLFSIIPVVIIMIGNLSGITQNVFEYLIPRNLNPMVLIFHGYIVLMWILSIWWVYFKKGAEFIEMHPGLIQTRGFKGGGYATAKQVKMFLPLMILGGVIGLAMLWFSDIKLPDFIQ